MTGSTGDLEVQNVPRTHAPRCECPELAEHGGMPCGNAAQLDDVVVSAPAVCTPCLFGCLP